MMDLWLPPKPAIIRPSEQEIRAVKKANFAPGWFPGGAIAPVARTLSFVASTSSNASSVNLPADIQAGDILIYLDIARDATTPTLVTPTGFTNISSTGNAEATCRVASHRRFADGTEDGLSRTGMAGSSSRVRKIVLQFRANQPLASITVGSINAQCTDGNPSSANITSSGGTAPVVLFAFYGCMGNLGDNGSVSQRNFSPAEDAEIANGTAAYAKYKILNTTASLADYAVDMTDDNGSQGLIGGYIQPTFA